jgi:hypothetical protein
MKFDNKLKPIQNKIKEEKQTRAELFDIYDWVEEFVDRAKDAWFKDKEFQGGIADYIRHNARQFENYVKQGKLSKEQYDEFVMLADLYADRDPDFINATKTRRKGDYLPKKPSNDLLYEFVSNPKGRRFSFDENVKKWYEEEDYEDPEIVAQNNIREQKSQVAAEKLKQLLANRKPKGN